MAKGKHNDWSDKYQPNTFEETIIPDSVITTIKNSFEEKGGSSFIFYGGQGKSKTALASVICKTYAPFDNLFKIGADTNNVRSIEDFVVTNKVDNTEYKKIVVFNDTDTHTYRTGINNLKPIWDMYKNNLALIFTTNNFQLFEGIFDDKAICIDFDKMFVDHYDEIIGKTIKRIRFILDSEKLKYPEDRLEKFIKVVMNKTSGSIRKTIELIQVSIKDEELDFTLLTDNFKTLEQVDNNFLEILNKLNYKEAYTYMIENQISEEFINNIGKHWELVDEKMLGYFTVYLAEAYQQLSVAVVREVVVGAFISKLIILAENNKIDKIFKV